MDNFQQSNQAVLIKNIISQRGSVTGTTIYYVLVHKESQSGLLFNERMLVAQDKQFIFFYTKHMKAVDQLLAKEKKGSAPIKEYLGIINTSGELASNIITIRFIKQNINKNWFFRFQSKELAVKWFILYKDLHERSIAKSIRCKTKDTASHSSLQQYSFILSKNKYYQSQHAIKEELGHSNKETEKEKDIEDSIISRLK